MINSIIWVIFGGLIGWVASMTLNKNAPQSIFINISVGIVGALVAGGLLTPLVGITNVSRNNFSTAALGVSLLGAVVLLVLLNSFQRNVLRWEANRITNLSGTKLDRKQDVDH